MRTRFIRWSLSRKYLKIAFLGRERPFPFTMRDRASRMISSPVTPFGQFSEQVPQSRHWERILLKRFVYSGSSSLSASTRAIFPRAARGSSSVSA